jgi:hypothetical protein
VQAPCEDKSNDVKDSFYEELARVFHQFPRYDRNILLGDFNAKVGREDIFKPTIGNESSHEISNDNEVRVINFQHLKTWLSKAPCSLIATFINTPGPSPNGKTHNQIDHVLIGDGIQVYLMSDLSEGLIVTVTIIW